MITSCSIRRVGRRGFKWPQTINSIKTTKSKSKLCRGSTPNIRCDTLRWFRKNFRDASLYATTTTTTTTTEQVVAGTVVWSSIQEKRLVRPTAHFEQSPSLGGRCMIFVSEFEKKRTQEMRRQGSQERILHHIWIGLQWETSTWCTAARVRYRIIFE